MPTVTQLKKELKQCKEAADILLDALRRIDKGVTEHHVGWKGEVLAARNEARLAIARYKVAIGEVPLE